jgi:hypothetical protein
MTSRFGSFAKFGRAAALVLGFVATSALAGVDSKAGAVLQASAEAMGEANFGSVACVRTKARIAIAGLKGTLEALIDAKTGNYWNFEDVVVDHEHDGYDGKSVWQQDGSGQVAIQGSEDAVRGAIDTAYQNAHGYWHNDKWPADIAYAGERKEGVRSFDVVRITPSGGRPFDLWFDTKTHVLDRSVERGAIRTNTTLFSDYRSVSGVEMPFRIHQTNGETKYDSDLTVDTIAFEKSAPPAIFSPPPPPKPDFAFASGGKSTTVPFRLINNHMYVEVRLNGKGPFEFLFDTGGSNVVTPTLARELGVNPQGAFQGSGVGEKSADVGLVKVERETIGGVHLDNQVFAVISLESFGAVEGRPITGIFGFEVFKRFVVKTDYENNQIVLTDPTGWSYAGPGTRTPFRLKEVIPVVDGEIDGIKGAFQLDTGSRLSLSLLTPFVERNKLATKYNAKLSGVEGWGVGGASRAWFVRVHRFAFGGVTVDEPVVGLSQQKSGALTDVYTAGNVGAGILKRFNITWDYPHSQIYFERNKNYSARDVFDRAGIWANLSSRGFDVVDVIANTPAAEAGLGVGDTILTVDGMKAGSEITLPDFRVLLRSSPGRKLKLEVLRGGQTVSLTIVLRDLV